MGLVPVFAKAVHSVAARRWCVFKLAPLGLAARRGAGVLVTLLGVIYSANTVADDIGALRKLLDPLQTLSGDFEQTITTKKGELVQKTTGTFATKRPGYFLWQSAAPFEQTIVGSPKKLWIYDPDLEQCTIRNRNPNDKNSPVRVISGDLAELHLTFEIKKLTGGKQVRFQLAPKNVAQANYQSVQLSFAKDVLQSIKFVDKLDQTTHVIFSALKPNTALAANIFEFVPPAGTDIIRDEQ